MAVDVIQLGDHNKKVRLTPLINDERHMSLRDVIECICNVSQDHANTIMDRLRKGGKWEELMKEVCALQNVSLKKCQPKNVLLMFS
jgi:hypothetical protein